MTSSMSRTRARAVPGKRAWIVAAIALLVISFDQLTKWWVTAWLGPPATTRRRDLLGEVLAFEYVENTGAAFGVLASQPWLVSILAGVVAVLVAVTLLRESSGAPASIVVAGLLLGGALGNLIDRARLGHVIDFIAVGSWPRFNVADSAISVGAALAAIVLIRAEQDALHPDADHRRQP